VTCLVLANPSRYLKSYILVRTYTTSIVYFKSLKYFLDEYVTCKLHEQFPTDIIQFRRSHSGNAYCYSFQNLLSSHLVSKNLKIRIYKTVILPVVLYGCETWSLTFGEEYRLRVFENRVLRIFLDLKGRKIDHGENCIMINFTTCILHRILLG
jgi:hypothetical protein